MHYSYDPQADALYIYLQEDGDVAKTIPIDDRRNVDLDAGGKVRGIEILSPGTNFPFQDLIDRFQLSEFTAFLESVSTTTFKPVTPVTP